MPNDTKDPRAATGRRNPGSAHKRPAPRSGFNKDRATLWLLTLTLGLGMGAGVRFLQRADQAQAASASAPRFSATQPQANAGTPFQNQRVTVLPQRSFRPRATSRMS